MATTKKSKAGSQPLFETMSIGDRLRWALEHRQVKQLHLAQRLGFNQSTISNIVTDASRSPSAATLLLLCDDLRLSPNWLITGKGDPFAWAPVVHQDQVEILNCWRAMEEPKRALLLQTAKALAGV